MKHIIRLGLVTVAFLFIRCGILEQVEERLAILGVNFEFQHLETQIIHPAILTDLPLYKGLQGKFELPGFDKKDWGVRLLCTIDAKNPNKNRAVFDGADFKLRVNETDDTDSAAVANVPSFGVGAASDTSFVIPFAITLDNSAFSYNVLEKIIEGSKIPYRLSADLFFNLIAPTMNDSKDTLGSKSITVDCLKDSVDTRPEINSKEAQLLLDYL